MVAIRRRADIPVLGKVEWYLSRGDGTPPQVSQHGSSLQEVEISGYQGFVYELGLGYLGEHNGRYAATPEYPKGTNFYVATLDAARNPAFRYILDPTYCGVVADQQNANS